MITTYCVNPFHYWQYQCQPPCPMPRHRPGFCHQANWPCCQTGGIMPREPFGFYGPQGGAGIPRTQGPQGPQGIQGPRGAQGAQGPAGPQGSAGPYGGRYNSADQPISFNQAETPVPVQLNTLMPAYHVSSDGTNGLTVEEDGDYEIFYHLLVSSNRSINLQSEVRRNGEAVISSQAQQTTAINNATATSHSARMTCTVIVALQAGDALDLALRLMQTVPDGLSTVVGGNADASLVIRKISPSQPTAAEEE